MEIVNNLRAKTDLHSYPLWPKDLQWEEVIPPRTPSLFDLDTEVNKSTIPNSMNLATTSPLTRNGSLVILPGPTRSGDLSSGTRQPNLVRPFVVLFTPVKHNAVGLSTTSDSPFFLHHAVGLPTRSQLYLQAVFHYFNFVSEPDHPPSPPTPEPSPTPNDE